MIRGVLLWILLVPGAALAQWQIPAGAEVQVQAWLRPLAEDAALADGWVLRDIAVRGGEIRLGVTAPAQTERQWLVVQPSTEDAVAVRCPTAVPAAVCAHVRAALAGPRSGAAPWRGALVEDEKPVPPLLRGPRPLVLGLWALLMLLGCLALPTLWRHCHRRQLLQALGAAALALALRLGLAPQTLLKEFYHAALSTEFLADGSVSRFGETTQAPALLIDQLFAVQMRGLFGIHLALAVLAVPAWMLLDAVLWGPTAATWLVGVLAATLPAFIRFSACEEAVPAVALLVPLTLATWSLWLRQPRLLWLALCVVSAMLAMLARPEMLALPVLHVTLLAAQEGRRALAALRRWSLWLGAVALGFIALPRLAVLLEPRQSHFSLRQLIALHAVGDAAMFDVLLLPLLAIGLLAAWRTQRQRTLWLLAAHGLVTFASLGLFMTPGPLAWRMQVLPTLLLLPILARCGDLTPPRRWPAWLRRRLGAGLRAAAAAVALLHVWLYREPIARADSAQAQEWQFLGAVAPVLPQSFRLLARSGVGHVAALPPVVLRWAGKTARTVTDPVDHLRRGAWPEPGADLVVYLGMSCWLRAGEAADMEVGPAACDAVRRRYHLEPLAVAALRPIPYPPAQHLPPDAAGYTVGFYRALAPEPPP